MATTGSNSSASTTEAPPRAGHLVIGIPAGPESEAATRQLARILLARPTPVPYTVIVARPGTAANRPRVTGADEGLQELDYPLRPHDALEMPYHGLVGRGRAIHAIFTEAHAAGAAGCIVLDARTADSLEWIDGFVKAVLEHELDFVSSVYRRHPFSSGLVHGVLAPLFTALYGVRVRYPIAQHFACSSRLFGPLLSERIWDTSTAQLGIEWWLATMAVSSGLRIGEVPAAALARDERPLADLSTITAQLVGFAFTDMERQARLWQRIRSSRDPLHVGGDVEHDHAPQIDALSLVESFRAAYRDLREVWEEVLPPLSMLQWRRLTTASGSAFAVADAVWARTLYDFAMGHRLRVIPRADLLRSLTPLYLAWLASFVLETRGASTVAVEQRLARLHSTFETEKPYLVSQWRWPERFKPVKLRR
jgi:hypothetical protein